MRIDGCATKGDQCGEAGETPNLSCSTSVIASKGSMRVGRTIEAIVNSNCRIGVRVSTGGAVATPPKYQ